MARNKSLTNITTIRTAMSTGTTFHIERHSVIFRVLTLNTDGSGTIRANEVPTIPTFFTDDELAKLASLAKGWNR